MAVEWPRAPPASSRKVSAYQPPSGCGFRASVAMISAELVIGRKLAWWSEIVLALADLGEDLGIPGLFHAEMLADCRIVPAQEGIGRQFLADRRRQRRLVVDPQRLDPRGALLQRRIGGVDAQ